MRLWCCGRLAQRRAVDPSLQAGFCSYPDDGSVVTWGHGNYGGDSGAVQDQRKGVQHIQASMQASAAILTDGLVVTWAASSVVATVVLCKIS